MERLVEHVAKHLDRARQQPALRDFGGDEPNEQEARHGEEGNDRPAVRADPGQSVGRGRADAQDLPPFQKVPGASSAPGPTSFSPPSSRKNW